MSTESNAPKKIAVVGPTQSGKTCLAVGLFSTSTSGFTIETVDTDGRSYLADLKAALQPGRDDAGNRKAGLWPEATNKGTKKDIRLDFQKKGKEPIRVAFPEFSGELLADDETFHAFANQHLRDLSGVVLLMNPGSDAFQGGDAKKLADAMTQYKRVIDFLKDPNNGSADAFVALTVTAADRLKGDLRGKLEAFEQTIEELSNSIGTAKLRYRRFNVSITGHLKEQDNPQLARGRKNSASEPFLWLLDELDWRPRRQALLRKIRRCALAVVAVAGLAGVWCGVDAWNSFNDIRKTENDLRMALDDCNARNNPSEHDLDAVRKPLAALRNRRSIWFRKYASNSADDFEPKVWNAHEKRIRHEMSAIASDPEKYGGDCGRVDSVFNAWTPSVARVAEERAAMKKQWDADKPVYQDAFAVAQMLESIRKPLREKQGLHGDEAFALFGTLYGKLAAATPSQPKSIALKNEVSAELDDRVGKEWREFAIPDFDEAAAGEATHDATRAFVARLADWNPVTTNGLAVKNDLMSTVSNSISVWRTTYETNHLFTVATDAVNSCDMAELANCFPGNVATNEFLSAAFIEFVWTNGTEAAFLEARQRFGAERVAAVEQRRGRPELTQEDIDAIRREVNRVQCPSLLDFAATTNAIHQLVARKADKWDATKRTECEIWIDEHVRPSMIRTGQAGLWTAYKMFSKDNTDNPFVDLLVRPAVYEQAEKWLQEDIVEFGKLNCSDVSYRSKAESLFDPFKNLCREIVRDENPLRTSWAWHFAIACCRDAKIDAIEYCFPQTLRVSLVEGKIEYDDYRKGYWGTYLNGSVSLLSMDGATAISNKVMDDASFEKRDNKSWKRIDGQQTIQIPIHLFDRIQCSLSLTDRNMSPGRELKCPEKQWMFQAGTVDPSEWMGGKTFDATFDLGAVSMWPLTTKDTTPDAHIRLTGSLDGSSVADFLAAAKRDAERERASLTENK